jgi:hypothetical protein
MIASIAIAALMIVHVFIMFLLMQRLGIVYLEAATAVPDALSECPAEKGCCEM